MTDSPITAQKRRQAQLAFRMFAETLLGKPLPYKEFENMAQSKPFLQLRKAIKRNASFDSDEVREGVLKLLDALEQDVEDSIEEDEEFEFSSTTEKFSVELQEALDIHETEEDEEIEDDN